MVQLSFDPRTDVRRTFDRGQAVIKNELGYPDISLAVIHERAKRPYAAKRSELVNNCETDIRAADGVSGVTSCLVAPERLPFR
jgi:hypothetical protein